MDGSLRSIGLAAVLATAAACGAHGQSSNPDFGQACTNEGEQDPCVCAGSTTPGTRTCGADLYFTACVCDGVDGGAVGGDLGAPVDARAGLDVVTVTDTPAVGVDRGVASGDGSFGAACTRLDQCASGVCLPSGRCSRACAGAADCPASIGWTCTALPGLGPVCGCTPRGAETCNGLDDDCNGVADDGITRCGGACVDLQNDASNCGGCGIACGGGTGCVRGACVCPASAATACGGRCVDRQSDPVNCGACGVTCSTGTSCQAGRCAATAGSCPSSCATGADCTTCRTPSDPAGSSYCCLSGLCIYTSSSACGTDAGTDAFTLPDASGDPTDAGGGGGGTDGSLSD